jgi:fructokinase
LEHGHFHPERIVGMNYDAVALGEYLIDFTPYGLSDAGQPLYERNPGGAPVNVAAAIAKLGKKVGFIGKVGDDPFGRYLQQTLKEIGVSDEGLVLSGEAHTTMAFVHLDAGGERSFHFARNPGADQLLSERDVNRHMLENTQIFHFGSILMTAEPSYTATIKAVEIAKRNGALISFDPNYRPSLWTDESHARHTIHTCLGKADLVKVSEDELFFLTGMRDQEAASKLLTDRYPIQLLLVTAGVDGSYYRLNESWGKVDSYPVQTVDTTGAGDGFLGAFLYYLLELGKPLPDLTKRN